MAVVDDKVPKVERVFSLLASAALKYLDGRAMVILPPLGMAVAATKPRVISPLLTVSGDVSIEDENAILTRC